MSRRRWLPYPRFSVLALIILAGLACRNEQSPEPSLGGSPLALPWLTDITDVSGIDFVHDTNAVGEFRFPEINGAGVGVLDYDNDGWYDLYFVQGGRLPGVEGGQTKSDQLYRNRGDGTFENVTRSAGINATGYGMGVVCGDYDNDGFVDIFVYNTGPNTMLHNDGDGTFSDVTAHLDLGDSRWGDGATFLDYDRDGLLDLFVCNYVAWDSAGEKSCFMSATGQRDYCGPLTLAPEGDILYRNNGDGTFTDVSTSIGLDRLPGSGMGVGVSDFDGDGWQEVYVGNDARPNRLLSLRPGHQAKDRASEMLCDRNEHGASQSSMGITIEDFDLDGRFDLLLGHFWNDPNTLYLNQGSTFRDASVSTGLAVFTRHVTTFGISALDLHNDGGMQLLFGNGKVNLTEKVITNLVEPYAERDLLLEWSFANGRFSDVTDSAGTALDEAHCTRGTAVIDFDNDGDMDVVITSNDGSARLLRCNAPPDNHWLQVRCIDGDGRRNAHGAVIEIEVDGRIRRRQVFVASSYCSSSDPRVHFGLGNAARIDRLTVTWVDGATTTWEDVAADQLFVAARDTGEGTDTVRGGP